MPTRQLWLRDDARTRAARYALGAIRILNGGLGLVAPQILIRRFHDPAATRNAAAIYGFRLFGVRTVLVGLDLFTLQGTELDRALQRAVLIHASDTATATGIAVRRLLPPRAAAPLIAISALNTALALAAYLPRRRVPRLVRKAA